MDTTNIIKMNDKYFRDQLLRYMAFWPYFIISVFIFIVLALTYLRYAENKYESYAIIEIIDKSQDSEMALPTSMTIFNRSMINLDNEIGVLKSFNLNKNVVKKIKSNITYFSIGNVKTTQNHSTDWYSDYNIRFNIDTDSIFKESSFIIKIENNNLVISSEDYFNEYIEFQFSGLSTYNNQHKLPFDLKINSVTENDKTKLLKFSSLESTTDYYRKLINIDPTGPESDQLLISIKHPNALISKEYLDFLISEFDSDGIKDRQLEYKRTMDFVDVRSVILNKELKLIEDRRQEFKITNNLSDVKSNASVTINQQQNYNTELFKVKSQFELIKFLKNEIINDKLSLVPLNIGIENNSINGLILEYNNLINDRNRFLISAGENNSVVKLVNKQLENSFDNLISSIENYFNILEINIKNLENKEKEYQNTFSTIPESEKILRSIERELQVKESLFILLLQKREEAAINFAVVKPSVKTIDNARNNFIPVSPNNINIIFLAIIFGLFTPFGLLFIYFYFDNKIHVRDHLTQRLNLPIVGEIPNIVNKEILDNIIVKNSRHSLSESIRLIVANLNFTFGLMDNLNSVKTILVTSSIKGEGKTLVSVNVASSIAEKGKNVLLIGADLRNPQIHKLISVKRDSQKGISDYISLNGKIKWKDIIIKKGNLNILLSGTIPPNPTDLLASSKFESFLNEVKQEYDYIIIDSAPCLLVSDTFEISKHVDSTLYVIRANYSDTSLCNFIQECSTEKKLKNISLVLNSVGSSKAYGYKYGYQYGYRYGYKYSYNYGYGYGYDFDK